MILNTGMKIGEALALEWSDIGFENKTLRVNKTLAKAKEHGEKGEVVSKLLGYADINTTYSTYIHVLNNQMIDVMDGISKI